MAIDFTKYVDIISGVGGNGGVAQRDLIGRIFTPNLLLNNNLSVVFTSASEVGLAFGTDSEEYKRAVQYFSFIGKNITSPRKLSFSGWQKNAAAPQITGTTADLVVADYAAMTDVKFTIDVSGTPATSASLDFSGVTDLAGVAAIIQSGIRAIGGTQLATCTVSFDSTNKNFTWFGDTAAHINTLSVADGGGADNMVEIMGWNNPSYFNGSDGQSVTNMLIASTAVSNNFGSFCFLRDTDDADLLAASTWNTTNNEQFMFCVAADVTDGPNSDYEGKAGTTVTIVDLTLDEYPEMDPMMFLASTDYTRRNSVINYMFQRPNQTPLKIDGQYISTAQSDAFDAVLNNYYAATQTAGQLIAFYQRGYMQGGATDASDQNVFANEIWLKDAAGTAILNLLLALGKVSANATGENQIKSVIQANAVDAALFNGTISVGKPLNTIQKLFIGQITGDDLAWHQVQSIGYWLDVNIQSYVTNNVTEWKAVYILVYSKDDDIRKVEGSHILI